MSAAGKVTAGLAENSYAATFRAYDNPWHAKTNQQLLYYEAVYWFDCQLCLTVVLVYCLR